MQASHFVNERSHKTIAITLIHATQGYSSTPNRHQNSTPPPVIFRRISDKFSYSVPQFQILATDHQF